MGFRRALILAFLAGCFSFASAQSDSIPLGDVARQKPAKKAHHVFTDDNTPRRAAPDPIPPAADNGAAEKTADANSEAAKPADDDMTATRKSLQELLTREQNLRWELVNLKKQADDAPVDSRRDVLLEVIDRRTADLDSTRAEITTTEQHLLELLSKQPKPAADAKPDAKSKDSKEAEDKPPDEPKTAAADATQPEPPTGNASAKD
jgi:hypothetical protein